MAVKFFFAVHAGGGSGDSMSKASAGLGSRLRSLLSAAAVHPQPPPGPAPTQSPLPLAASAGERPEFRRTSSEAGPGRRSSDVNRGRASRAAWSHWQAQLAKEIQSVPLVHVPLVHVPLVLVPLVLGPPLTNCSNAWRGGSCTRE